MEPSAVHPVLPLLTLASETDKHKMLADLRAALPHERIDTIDNLSHMQTAQVDVAIAANPAPEMFEQLPNLHWVQSMWAGVDNMLEHARRNNFKLVRLVDPKLTESMAEAVLAWTLYLHRRMPEYSKQQREHSWQQLRYTHPGDRRVSLLGLGEIGAASAQRLATNGFKVSGWSRSKKTLPNITSYSGSDGLQQMLTSTDILVILLPLTPATRAVVNSQTLACLPKRSSLINFARGAVVDTDDLLHALEQGTLNHAVLDVFDEEPLPKESLLWEHEQVTVLPHIAALTDPESAAQIAANHIASYRDTGVLPATIDLLEGY